MWLHFRVSPIHWNTVEISLREQTRIKCINMTLKSLKRLSRQKKRENRVFLLILLGNATRDCLISVLQLKITSIPVCYAENSSNAVEVRFLSYRTIDSTKKTACYHNLFVEIPSFLQSYAFGLFLVCVAPDISSHRTTGCWLKYNFYF